MRTWTSLTILALSGCLVTTSTRRAGEPPPPPPHTGPVAPAPTPTPAHAAAYLTGVIVDKSNNKPIDRAAVDVNSPVLTKNLTVQTGPDGRYTTAPIPPGDFVVRVRRSGYETQQQRLSVGNATATLDFALVPLRR